MAGNVRNKRVKARRASQLALSPDDAKQVLERVNTARMRLHDRLAALRIFRDANNPHSVVQGGDHPLVQILLAMRDHVDAIDATPALTPQEAVTVKGRMLEAMSKTTQAIITEAGRASIEVRAMAESMMTLEQRSKEHQDKMEILRAKSPLTQTKGTTADLLRNLGSEPIVILDDDDPTLASPSPEA